MWQMKNTKQRNNARKLCDVHMEAQEKEKKRMRESNQVMMTPSRDGISATQFVLNDNVTICCPNCKAGE